jgi:hypothetical protein
MNKTGLMAGLAIFVCACGGSDTTKSFTYGAPTIPSENDTTVSSASSKLMSAIQLQQGGVDASTALDMFGSMNLGSLFESSSLRNPFPPGKPSLAISGGSDVNFTNPNCYTVTATSVTYTNCQVTYNEVAMTISGSVTASATSVSWNITLTMNMTSESMTANVTASGHYAFAANSLVGSSTIAMDMTVQQNHVGVSIDEDVNITFTLDQNACNSYITGGSYEIGVHWTSVPAGYANEFKDRGVRLTWPACGTVLIARSL